MHIPDSMLNGHICPVTAAVSAAGIGLAAYYGFKSRERPTASRFAATSALIFALQMMNFPINHGTSGHLLGGALAAWVLGTPFAILSLAVVITIQSLVFSDGGLSVLGANVFNMAVIGAGIAGLVRSTLATRQTSAYGEKASLCLAAWLSVVVASLAASIELFLGGQVAFVTVASAMVGTHAMIGIGEAAITLACCQLLSAIPAALSTKRQVAIPFASSIVIALVLSPFASSLPDGLEWVAGKYNFFHESAPTFVGPMPDYAFPYITNSAISTGMAGLAGVFITFGMAWVLSRLISRPLKTKIMA